MAVFSTNLVIYKHTDFEQTFLLEDSQSNSAKDLTGFSGTCKMQRTLNLGSLTSFNLSIASTITENLQGGRHVYDIILTRPSGFKFVAVEGNALVRSGINTMVHYFGSP